MTLGCWIQRTMPDPHLPSGATPFHVLFRHDTRENLGALTPKPDGDNFRTGLGSFLAENQQTFMELREVLKIQQDDKNHRRQRHNVAIHSNVHRQRPHLGDTLLVKEADSVLAREDRHGNLAHEHRTGPRRISAVI